MLTSRVHPGETGASWMIHGVIDTLLNPKNAEEEKLVNNLKDHFEFYIIPMLNVDGVINQVGGRDSGNDDAPFFRGQGMNPKKLKT